MRHNLEQKAKIHESMRYLGPASARANPDCTSCRGSGYIYVDEKGNYVGPVTGEER